MIRSFCTIFDMVKTVRREQSTRISVVCLREPLHSHFQCNLLRNRHFQRSSHLQQHCLATPDILFHFSPFFFFPFVERTIVGYFQFAPFKAMKRDFMKRGLQSCCPLCIATLGSFSELTRAPFLKWNHTNSSRLWQWHTCKNLSAALFSLLPAVDFHLNFHILLSFFRSLIVIQNVAKPLSETLRVFFLCKGNPAPRLYPAQMCRGRT